MVGFNYPVRTHYRNDKKQIQNVKTELHSNPPYLKTNILPLLHCQLYNVKADHIYRTHNTHANYTNLIKSKTII